MRKSRTKSGSYIPYLMIAPSILLIVAFVFIPIVQVFNLSVQHYDYNDFENIGYIGLQNFKKIFTSDDVFFPAALFTLKWVIVEVALQLVLGLALALLLNRKFRFRGLARSLSLVPWAVSGVLTTMLWMLIFDQNIGLINLILIKCHVPVNMLPSWLNDEKLVFPSVVLAELWRGVPFFTINFLAALQSVPEEVYESCDVDGAAWYQKLLYITLPYIKESIFLTTLLRCIWEFNSIDMLFTMTNGGPVNETTTLALYMMKTSIVNGDYGYGSAVGVIVFIFLLIFAVFYLKVSHMGGEEKE
ncbi:MAG: sugar ABC transporter permease [Oscillospiraceae bacterium]|nr:sugar ABC transporter permease [Oscillospiraceae bacterium]